VYEKSIKKGIGMYKLFGFLFLLYALGWSVWVSW
jgi:hypothetical protein